MICAARVHSWRTIYIKEIFLVLMQAYYVSLEIITCPVDQDELSFTLLCMHGGEGLLLYTSPLY